MNFTKHIIIGGIFTFFGSSLYAQNNMVDEILAPNHATVVAQVNDYISFMASKRKSLDNRKYYKEKALHLFIGNGYHYEENGTEKEGVVIEITSSSGKVSSKKLIRNYFDDIIQIKYQDIKVTSTEVAYIKISNIYQIDDSLYACTCQYDQAFLGYRDGKPIYKKIETKHVKCYISYEDTVEGCSTIVKLGDMTALDLHLK